MMTAADIRRLNDKLRQISSLDESLDKLAERAEDNFAPLGVKVRDVLGRHVLSMSEDVVGKIAWVALFNYKLDQREALRAEIEEDVEVEPSRHQKQVFYDAV